MNINPASRCLLIVSPKPTNMRKISLLILLTGSFLFIQAQKSSIDLAYIRNLHTDLNGFNVSYFQHFTERFTGGLELNRFPKKRKTIDGEEMDQSAWDFDLNIHYLIPLNKQWRIYPITGFSHTSENEESPNGNVFIKTRFFSFNTGAGILYQAGKWAPHAEYLFTWGFTNQHFFLAGISYEIEWKKEK